MATRTRIGVRAITMQQPFAAAMAHGQTMYTRRGKPAKFHGEEGEWIAIHCGSNKEHVKNSQLMARVREHWPECPSDEELLAQQKTVVGLARFVDGNVCARAAERADFFVSVYDCKKASAWRTDAAIACARPLSYPKGALQVWHLYSDGFADSAGEAELLALRDSGMSGGGGKVKEEGATGAGGATKRKASDKNPDAAAASSKGRGKASKTAAASSSKAGARKVKSETAR